MKFIVRSSGLKTGFSELKDHVAVLDRKKRETSIEEAQHKQEDFKRYLKEIKIIRNGNKSEKQKKPLANINEFLTEEMMLSNL